MNPKRILGLALSLLFSAQALGADKAMAANVLRTPTALPKPAPRRNVNYTPDILLVMPNGKTGTDDLQKALDELHGTVIGSMGEGRLKCLIVRTEKGKLVETEAKMKRDKKDFFCVGRDYQLQAEDDDGTGSSKNTDPEYGSEWYITRMNVNKAWTKSTGAGVTIGILDTGCQSSNPDISNKTQKGFDATSFWAHMMGLSGIPTGITTVLGGIGLGMAEATNGGAQTDVMGHGTWVATTAAATRNNGFQSAGVAPDATIYPIRVANGQGFTDPIALQAGILQAMLKGIKIINISYGFQPPFGLTDPALYPTLHAYMAFYHDVYGGLVFMSAGNDSMWDEDPNLGYVDIVSAIEPNLTLTTFSNYGNCITYTAPGLGIACSSKDGSSASKNGTSFSSPIVAAIAALVWSANPGLSNYQVDGILKASCAGTVVLQDQAKYYGNGMPDANIAVNLAAGNFPNAQ
jgi:thermitase